MQENNDIEKLYKIYYEMDAEGRQKMTQAASHLLTIQKILKNGDISPSTTKHSFLSIVSCIISVILLVITAYFFWITILNPTLLMTGITPPFMVRIIITAFCGLLIMGTGLFSFILRKLKIPLLILAISAGVLCVDPGVLTDIIGFSILLLVIAWQVIDMKFKKT